MKISTILFLLFLICFSITTYCQSYLPGKIYNGTDTLSGFIKERVDKKNSSKCYFKTTLSQKAVSYTPDKINGYELENGKKYRSVKVKIGTDSVMKFLQLINQGDVNAYFLRQKDGGDRFFIENNGVKKEIIGKTEIVVRNNRYFTKGDYQELLRPFLESCEAGSYHINKIKFNRKDISQAVNQHNECVHKTTYKYSVQKNSLVWGIKAGYYPLSLHIDPFASYNKSEIHNYMGLQIGAFISEQIADIDKKLFIQVDVLYNHFHFDNAMKSNINVNLINIPATFKYYILPKKLSPYIIGGGFIDFNLSRSSSDKSFNIDNINAKDSGLTYGGGLRLNKGTHEISLEYRFQKILLNGAGSDYSFQVNAHTISLVFGFVKK